MSIVCFYLALPALYLLLRRLKVAPAHSLVVLSFVVLCPLYIFYERSGPDRDDGPDVWLLVCGDTAARARAAEPRVGAARQPPGCGCGAG